MPVLLLSHSCEQSYGAIKLVKNISNRLKFVPPVGIFIFQKMWKIDPAYVPVHTLPWQKGTRVLD